MGVGCSLVDLAPGDQEIDVGDCCEDDNNCIDVDFAGVENDSSYQIIPHSQLVSPVVGINSWFQVENLIVF